MWKPNRYQWITMWATFALVSFFWLDSARGGYITGDTVYFLFGPFTIIEGEATAKAIGWIIAIAGVLLAWMFQEKSK